MGITNKEKNVKSIYTALIFAFSSVLAQECVEDFGMCDVDADCCNSMCFGGNCGGMLFDQVQSNDECVSEGGSCEWTGTKPPFCCDGMMCLYGSCYNAGEVVVFADADGDE